MLGFGTSVFCGSSRSLLSRLQGGAIWEVDDLSSLGGMVPLRRLAFHGGKFPSGCLFHIPMINSLVKQDACTRRWHNHLSHSLCFSRDYSASTCTCRPPHTQKPPGGIANFVGGTYLCLEQRVSVSAALRQDTHVVPGDPPPRYAHPDTCVVWRRNPATRRPVVQRSDICSPAGTACLNCMDDQSC